MCAHAIRVREVLDRAERFDWEKLTGEIDRAVQAGGPISGKLKPAVDALTLLSRLDGEWIRRYDIRGALRRFRADLPGADIDPEDVDGDAIDPETLHGRFYAIWDNAARSATAWRLIRERERAGDGEIEGDLIDATNEALRRLGSATIDEANNQPIE